MLNKLLKTTVILSVLGLSSSVLAMEQTANPAPSKKYLVVLLHGVGGEASHMSALMQDLIKTHGQKFADQVEVYTPQAPKKRWFVEPGVLEYPQLYVYARAGWAVTDLLGEFRANLTQLRLDVEKRLQDLGLGYENLIIGGYSMGCITALTFALESPKSVLAVVGSGGMWMLSDVNSVPKNIVLTNGSKDNVVTPAYYRPSFAALRTHVKDVPFETIEFAEEGHEFSQGQINEILQFLNEQIFSKDMPKENIQRQTEVACERPRSLTNHLESQHIHCFDLGVLNQFQFVREMENGVPTTNFRYDYTIAPVSNVAKAEQRNTEWNDDGEGNIVYLDRHDVACNANEAMTEFQLVRDPSAKLMRFEYSCKDVKLTDVQTYETAFSDDGRGQNIYLERHNVKCPSERPLLNSFKLVRDSTFSLIKYVYQCGIQR